MTSSSTPTSKSPAENLCYFNGSIIPLAEVRINPYDIGFLRGYGVFDYLKVYQGKPFLLKEHLIRFQNSAKALNLSVPLSIEKIEAIVAELLQKNNAGTCAVRLVLSGGVSDSLVQNKELTFLILVEDAHPLAPELYENGAKLITKEYDRPVPSAKHSNYSFAAAHQDERLKADAVEILYLADGEVRECSTSNIFVIGENWIATPKENVLIGMTRNYIIDLVNKNLTQEFKMEERRVTALELFSANECFITASNKEVVPIVAIDGRPIGDGKVGATTRRIMELFQQSVRKDLNLS